MGKIVSVYEHFGLRTTFRNELSSCTEVWLYFLINCVCNTPTNFIYTITYLYALSHSTCFDISCAIFRENFYVLCLKLLLHFMITNVSNFIYNHVQTKLASIKNCRKSRVPIQSRHPNSRPSDIPVQYAKDGKSNSEEQCTESR